MSQFLAFGEGSSIETAEVFTENKNSGRLQSRGFLESMPARLKTNKQTQVKGSILEGYLDWQGITSPVCLLANGFFL